MEHNFVRAYGELLEYIRQNPEIEIGDSVTSIPETLRPEFYHHFNAVREAFVSDRFPDVLRKAGTLQEHYAKAEKDLSRLISWEESSEVSRVQRFLCGVSDSMGRELFDPLFDLLKKRTGIKEFQDMASSRIAQNWPALFQGGYEKWAVLSLVKLLEPETILRVEARALKQGERAKSASYAPWDDVPVPQESSEFLFTQPRNAILTVPDLIVPVPGLKRFVGFRSEFRDGLYKALNPSQKREWLPLDTELLILLESGLTLIYVAEDPGEIALIADITRFCRPDMVLWCVDSQNQDRADVLGKLAIIDQKVGPALGCMAIITEPWLEPQPESDERSPRIRLLTTGFDVSRLREVVTALGPGGNMDMT